MQQKMSPYGMPVMGFAFGLEDLGKTLAPGFYSDVGAKQEECAGLHNATFQLFLLTLAWRQRSGQRCGSFCICLGHLRDKASVPIWILVYGGVALDISLIKMGHHITAALGNHLTLTSPSRGFCVELGAMFTVMVISKLGISVSTTYCISMSTTYCISGATISPLPGSRGT